MNNKVIECYLIRHGEISRTHSDGTLYGLSGGNTDIPLNDKGRMQAHLLADRFEEVPIKAIYSSSLSRAVDTVTPLARRKNLEIRESSDLRERLYGEAEGITSQEEIARYGQILDDLRELPYSLKRVTHPLTGMESDAALLARTYRVFHAIADRHAGQNVAVVWHNDIMTTFLRSLGAVQDEQTLIIGYTGVAHVVYSAGETPMTPGKLHKVEGMNGITVQATRRSG